MSIGIIKTPAIHETVVQWVHGTLSTVRQSLVYHFVHVRAARTGERKQTFGLQARVADLPLRKCLEKRLAQEHHGRVVVHNHAGGLIIRELWIELEAKLPEKIHRP